MTNFDSTAVQVSGRSLSFNPLDPGAAAVAFSGLSDSQRQQLLMEYAQGTLEVGRKANEMHVDAANFREMLDTMANQTKAISEQSGASVTLQHTHQSSVGRTEVIMGNTAQAASGRLTRTMADRGIPWHLIIGAIIILTLVSMFLRH